MQQKQQDLSKQITQIQREGDASELALKSATERHQTLLQTIQEATSELDELNLNPIQILIITITFYFINMAGKAVTGILSDIQVQIRVTF